MDVYCVVCYNKLFDMLHPPVKQSCSCMSRVCRECRKEVVNCPSCREPSLHQTTIDNMYLSEVCRLERSVRCEGCGERKATRFLSAHQAQCISYLTRALQDSRRELSQTQKLYRQTTELNTRLTGELNWALQTLDYLNVLLTVKQQEAAQAARTQNP